MWGIRYGSNHKISYTYKVEEEVVVYKMWKKEKVVIIRFDVNERNAQFMEEGRRTLCNGLEKEGSVIYVQYNVKSRKLR